MVELPRSDSGHEDAPNVAPTIRFAIEFDDLVRSRSIHIFVEEQSHGRCRTAEDDELYTSFTNHRSERHFVGELEIGKWFAA